ncbi:EAL domain-containing protein [Desulfallas thermosapovorans]|uniref:EAL domain-containing protein n=1 Tax=Desulfallas thermosapovorans TaxID=58137 RepID=UPI001411C93C|nr:EAL domain-containing protein [Desulfallas thermosapovorans]
MKRNFFELHFQPVADIKSGQVAHYETLLRLRLKNGKLIMPNSFIKAAESFGLMPQLDRWVVKSTLEIMSNHAELNTFINLSGTSLGDENLLDTIEYDIRHSDVEPSRIGFEITETSAVKDVKLAECWIRRIKNLGCTFALDDFGIGFSSFSYLRMLSVDYLKIDGSFVRNVAKDPTNWALVESMNSIAHTLGKKTIAEFVENHDTSIALKTMGIDLGQGFYFGRPRPLDLIPRVG